MVSQHIKKMIKFTALFTTGTVALGFFSISGFVNSFKENSHQDLKLKSEQSKVIEEAHRFVLESREQKETISAALKSQEKAFLESFDRKSEEMPELLENILNILDGKSSDSPLDLIQKTN
jgi:hypothetical protein